MPTSLPPLPDEIDDSQPEPDDAGDAEPMGMPSALGGGMPPAMQAAQMIEQGYKLLATSMPSLVPMAAQAISQLRMILTAPPPGADASAPPPAGPPTGPPAITGNTQGPSMFPPPPEGM